MENVNFGGITILQEKIDKKVETKIDFLTIKIMHLVENELDLHIQHRLKINEIQKDIKESIKRVMSRHLIEIECNKLINK